MSTTLTLDAISREWLRQAITRETARKVAQRMGISESGVSLMRRPEAEQDPADRRYVQLSHLDAYARSFPMPLGDVMQQLTDLVKYMERQHVQAPASAETDIDGARVLLRTAAVPPAPTGAGPRRSATASTKTAPASGSAPPRRRRHR